MVELWDYQRRGIAELRAERGAGHHRLVFVLPTGGGKTTVAADLIGRAVAKGRPVLVLAHRTELIDQMSRRLAVFHIAHGVIKAGRPATPGALVQVASVQSLARRPVPPAELVIVDEGHRTLGPSYLRVLDACPGATVVGLTATPIRLDGRGLGDVYTAMVQAATFDELIALGVLLRPRVFAPSSPDLAGVGTVAGDFNRLQLAEAMDKPQLVGDMVRTWRERAAGRRSVAFAASVEHSVSIRDAFRAAGVAAEHVDGETPEAERAAILAGLEAGRVTVVSNFGVLTEGYDCPPLAVCILARPTKSLGLYLQMVGRIERACEGKDAPILLDHAGCALMHGLPTQEREWTLDTTRKRKSGGPAVRQCLACYAITAAGAEACPECGAAFPRAPRTATAAPPTRAGELRELTEDQVAARKRGAYRPAEWRRDHAAAMHPRAGVEERAALYAALKRYGAERAYKPRWAAWAFNGLTGAYPNTEVREAAREEVRA